MASNSSDDDMPPQLSTEDIVAQIRILTAAVQSKNLEMMRVNAENAELRDIVRRGGRNDEGLDGHRNHKSIINFKVAVTVRKYTGNVEDWADWSFIFKRILNAMEPIIYQTMNYLETMTTELNEAVEFSGNSPDDVIRRKSSAELFDVLCNVLTGDALAMVFAHG